MKTSFQVERQKFNSFPVMAASQALRDHGTWSPYEVVIHVVITLYFLFYGANEVCLSFILCDELHDIRFFNFPRVRRM